MKDIPIDDSKNMDSADWLLQIKMIASGTHSQEYDLATAKSTSTPYKMLKRLDNDLDWYEMRGKLEEVYSPIATKVSLLVTYTINRGRQNFAQIHLNVTDLTEKAMGTDPAIVTNRVIIFLFIKNLFNKNIRRRVAGTKAINTLPDAFRLAHYSL